MKKSIPLSVSGVLIMPDGSTKPMELITNAEKQEWEEKRIQRMKILVAEYYNLHQTELNALKEENLN